MRDKMFDDDKKRLEAQATKVGSGGLGDALKSTGNSGAGARLLYNSCAMRHVVVEMATVKRSGRACEALVSSGMEEMGLPGWVT